MIQIWIELPKIGNSISLELLKKESAEGNKGEVAGIKPRVLTRASCHMRRYWSAIEALSKRPPDAPADFLTCLGEVIKNLLAGKSGNL